jgi:hypothetical protein
LLDVHEIAELHFPDLSSVAFEASIRVAYRYFNFRRASVKDEQESLILRRLVKTVIHVGSEEGDHNMEEQQAFTPHEGGCGAYQVFVNRIVMGLDVERIHSDIMHTCRKEFEKAEDWRVKESAILATCISVHPHQGIVMDRIK